MSLINNTSSTYESYIEYKKSCESSLYNNIHLNNCKQQLLIKECDLESIYNINSSFRYFNFTKLIPIYNIKKSLEKNMKIIFNDICLSKEIGHAENKVISTLSNLYKAHSEETDNHVKRVAKYAKLLSLKYGMSNRSSDIIKISSVMHDIGKLAVPNYILNKPFKLTKEEFEIIKTHSEIGYNIFKNSSNILLRLGAIISLEHHERYDGTGYPYGIKGDEIHIAGRIIAIADVFDALCSKRSYKDAWNIDSILDYFREKKGTHFDPFLTDILIKNIDEIINIKITLSNHKNIR